MPRRQWLHMQFIPWIGLPVDVKMLWWCHVPLLWLLAQSSSASAAACFPEERETLLGFVGQPICSVTWDTSTDCCTWENVQCNQAGHVISLDLALQPICPSEFTIPRNSSLFKLRFLEDLRLVGRPFEGDTIPQSLANLVTLRVLRLGNNVLKGGIPDFFGNFKNLTSLSLDENLLSGKIPDSLGKLANLVDLDLSRNSLSGNVPLSIFNLPKLQTLVLNSNLLGGALPSAVRSDSNLKLLWANNNKLTGKIPGWLFSRRLESIFLANNSFTGPIEPFPEPRNVTALYEVDLRLNQIQGSIPSSLFQHVNLTTIKFASNQLSGAIEWNLLRNLKNLYSLNLQFNEALNIVNSNNATFSLPSLNSIFLSGCGLTKFPTFFNALDELIVLDVSRNKLSGRLEFGQGWTKLLSFDASFNMLTSLTSPPPCTEMNLSHNQLAGDIPIGFSAITTWDVSYNRFTGVLPSKVFAVSSIKSANVDLSSNRFTGSIPRSIAAIPQLNVSNNLLSGHIPTSFRRSRNFQWLDLSSNTLSGGIPSEFGRFLQRLDLSSNNLTGMIPSNIGDYGELTKLDLSSNMLGGGIPVSVGNLKNLESLDLSSNALTGTIPKGLADLSLLEHLNVSYNHLQGPIPQGLNFPISSFVGNDELCGPLLNKPC